MKVEMERDRRWVEVEMGVSVHERKILCTKLWQKRKNEPVEEKDDAQMEVRKHLFLLHNEFICSSLFQIVLSFCVSFFLQGTSLCSPEDLPLFYAMRWN